MSTRPQLSAEHRDVVGKKVATLRRAGMLPAVVYGHDVASESIQIDARRFEDLRRHAGRNALVDLTVAGGASRPVLLHAVQEHVVTRRPLHADFLVVRMTEEMIIEVPIAFIGESLAIEKLGGTLLHMRDNVQVRALPADLPSSIELDITPLDSFEGVLHVSDLQIPLKVTLLSDLSEPVARIQPPRTEAEPVLGEEAAVTEPIVGEGEGEASDEASA